MNAAPHQGARAIVLTRKPTDNVLLIKCRIERERPNKVELFDMYFSLEWWAQYHVYRALPVMRDGNSWSYVHCKVSDAWYRLIKRYFKHHFEIRHIQHLNQKDNSKRVNKLLGLQLITS